MKLDEKTIEKKYIYKGRIINVRTDTAELPNGKQALREVVEHPGGVTVAALTDNDELMFVRQFRYPYSEVLLELPAGKLEYGEDPFEAGKRELREETGYRVVRPSDGSPAVRLMPQAGLSSTGMTDEQVQICFARVERAGDAEPEENELIEPFTVPVNGLRRFLDENRNPIGTRCQLVLEMYAHAFPQDKDGGYL